MSPDKYIPKSCGPVKNTFLCQTKLYTIYTSNVYHFYKQGLKRVPCIELDICQVKKIPEMTSWKCWKYAPGCLYEQS